MPLENLHVIQGKRKNNSVENQCSRLTLPRSSLDSAARPSASTPQIRRDCQHPSHSFLPNCPWANIQRYSVVGCSYPYLPLEVHLLAWSGNVRTDGYRPHSPHQIHALIQGAHDCSMNQLMLDAELYLYWTAHHDVPMSLPSILNVLEHHYKVYSALFPVYSTCHWNSADCINSMSYHKE